MSDQNPWNAIKRYQENGAGAISSANIRFGNLRSGTGSDSVLKVRKVLTARVDDKSKRLKTGYVSSFPMCVRRTEEGPLDLTHGVLGGTEMFDVFDGNHRYHAIKKLIKEGSTIYNDDTGIPCIIYKKGLSDTLAMTHAAIVNDMQMAANGGTVLDVLRFLSNMKARVLNSNGPQTDKVVSEMVVANIVDFFNSQGATTPSSWQGTRFVPCALSFLKHLGAEGLAECERLLDRDPEGMYNLLATITQHLPGANWDALIKNPDFKGDRACFLPDRSYLYRISWKGISNRPGGAITLMQGLYAKWFFGGGKTITEQELMAIIGDVKVDLEVERPEPPYPDELALGASEPVSTAEYEGQPVESRMKLLTHVTNEDLASADTFKDKLASMNLTLKDEGPVPEQLRKSFMAALCLCVPKEVCKDADSAEAAAARAEGAVWRKQIGLPGHRPEHGHLAAHHIVEDNLWILHHMAGGSTLRPGGAALETATVAPDHIALFDSLLEALILVELVGTGSEANRTSLVPIANTILGNCMRAWQDCELGLENPSPQFTAGRTFLNCEPTEQGVLIQEAEKAKAIKLHRDAAVVLRRQTRLAAAARKAQLILDFSKRRHAERELAKAAAEEAVKSRYNDINALLEKYSTDMTNKHGETLKQIGLHPYGFATIETKSMSTLLPDQLSVEQKAGIQKSTMFFIDSRDMNLTLEKHVLDFPFVIDLYKNCGGTGVVSVLCEPDCVLYVYRLLENAGYTNFDHPYLIEATQEASTLGNQQATDSWGVHPLLRKRHEENTPYGTPFAVIISARTKHGREFAKWDSLKTDPKKFALNLDQTNPATRNAIRDKYRFALDISQYSQRDPEAPQCKEFPMVQAYANFLWWNMTCDDEFLVTCCGDASFPVCAVHAQSTYVLAFDFLQDGALEEALHTSHLLSASNTPTDIHAVWNGYPLDVHLTVCHDLALASMLQPNLDAISILVAQTQGEYRRVERSENFWRTAFKPLHLMPCLVQMPGAAKGTVMLGLEAEDDIDAGATLCKAQIFWWTKGDPPPTRANMGLDPANVWGDARNELSPFGVDLLEVKDTDLRLYMINDSAASLINDFRGFTATPNASLVQWSWRGVGGELEGVGTCTAYMQYSCVRTSPVTHTNYITYTQKVEFTTSDNKPTFEIGIVSDVAIKKGQQITIDYSSKFWSSDQEPMEGDPLNVSSTHTTFCKAKNTTSPHVTPFARARSMARNSRSTFKWPVRVTRGGWLATTTTGWWPLSM